MKKLLSLLLCLCLCLTMLSAFALTASAAEPFTVYINGEKLGYTPLNVNGGTASLAYDNNTDSLTVTLENCLIGSSYDKCGIYISAEVENINLLLCGSNECESGVYVQRRDAYDKGTLTVRSGSTKDGSLTVNGTFTADIGTAKFEACKVTITGANTMSDYPVYFHDKVVFGAPAVKGGGEYTDVEFTVDTNRAVGLHACQVVMNSGIVNLTGAKFGLWASGAHTCLTVNGGIMECSGSEAAALLNKYNNPDYPPYIFNNGCGEYSNQKVSTFSMTDTNESTVVIHSWMSDSKSDLKVTGTAEDYNNFNIKTNAAKSVCFRKTGATYVTFNAGEYGTVNEAILCAANHAPIGTMPVPAATTDNMVFEGWYVGDSFTGTFADETYVVDGNTTFHALWKEAEGGMPFTDVKASDWFYNNVKYCYIHSLMNGTNTTVFSPDSNTSRAMVVTVLYRMEGSPTVYDTESPFTDISKDWYTDAVIWASNNGIVNGVAADKFAPNDNITREQLAAIMFRYAGFRGYDVSQINPLSSFADAASVNDYAVTPFGWANKAGLITGMSVDGKDCLVPQGNATRAQVAAILSRFVKAFEGNQIFSNDCFRVYVPGTWQGNVVCHSQRNAFGVSLSFYCKEDYEKGFGGWLFSITVTDQDYTELPHYEVLGKLTKGSASFDVIKELPTGIEFDYENGGECYLAMSKDKEAAVNWLDGINGWTFVPVS